MQTINLLKNYNTILYITNINNIVDLEYLIQNLNISSIKIVKSFKSLRYVNNYKMNDWNSKDYNKKIFEINNKYKINNLDNINRILSNNGIQSIKIYKNNIKLLQQLHYLNINKLYIHIKNITTIAQLSFSASNLIILINNKHESITIKDALFLIDTITNFNTKSIKIMNLIITNNNDLNSLLLKYFYNDSIDMIMKLLLRLDNCVLIENYILNNGYHKLKHILFKFNNSYRYIRLCNNIKKINKNLYKY